MIKIISRQKALRNMQRKVAELSQQLNIAVNSDSCDGVYEQFTRHYVKLMHAIDEAFLDAETANERARRV